MRTRMGGLAATGMAAALVVCGGVAPAGQVAAPQQVPEFRSGVEAVTVDVGVVDRQGRPVRGLSPGDFAVTVAGRTRRVVSAEFVGGAPVRADGAPQDAPALVSTNEGGIGGRLVVFVVDQSTLDTGSARRVGTAASRFLSQLTYGDRSALILLPIGQNIDFTWAHDRVRNALQHLTGIGQANAGWEFGSLTEARAIANREQLAIRMVTERECGGSSFADDLSPVSSSSGNTPSGSQPAPGSAPSSTGGGGGTSGGGRGGTSPRVLRSSGVMVGDMNACARTLQSMAETTWRSAHMTSLGSLSSLRQVFRDLARVNGDKTIVLISGGWPLEDREETSLLDTIASEAAAAGATIFSVFVSPSAFSAERRTMALSPVGDRYLHQAPLENLSAMTGGSSYRADVGAEGAFDRLSRELLGGRYRLGIEKDPGDATGDRREMKIRVARDGVTVRARDFFDARTYDDRDWAARLDGALEAAAPATSVGLRVTTYLASGQAGGEVKLVIAGEASRMQPGPATLQLLVRDLEGRKVVEGEQRLGEAAGDALPFSTNVGLAPGSYIMRLAVQDGQGRVGSVDHRVNVTPVARGGLSVMGPLLIRVRSNGSGEPRIALDTVRQDERLAIEVDVEGEKSRLEAAAAALEIAAAGGGPALVHEEPPLTRGSRDGAAVVQAVADMRLLPPGSYVVRARIAAGAETIAEVERPFVVAGTSTAASGPGAATATDATPRSALSSIPGGVVPSFAVEQALAPQVLGAFLDRVAARPDAASLAARELLDRARTSSLAAVSIAEPSPSEGPVPPFVQGLALLARNELDPAARSFRAAMRAAPDFYPAMVYLGACWAAVGNDKQAAGAWRTALIKETETSALHVWLADALLRQGRADEALEAIEPAREQWPADIDLKRRFVAAALLAGRSADGLKALDDLLAAREDDLPSLTFGLLVLYQAFMDRHAVESLEADRTRMARLAAAYRARGGPSQALVDTWLKAIEK